MDTTAQAAGGNRFDYVKYDDKATTAQAEFKSAMQALEKLTDKLSKGRAQSLVLTKLEEAFMWVGKAIRDDQIVRTGAVSLQESRGNE